MYGMIDGFTRVFGRALPAAALFVAFVFLAATASAQQNLSPTQQSELAQCLIGCKKGDAGCQNGCTQNTAGADYFQKAGSCVRACADALVGPGQKEEQAGDVKACVQACN